MCSLPYVLHHPIQWSGSTQQVKKKESIELDDEERKVMNTFIRQGVMTKEEFLEQVKLMRGSK